MSVLASFASFAPPRCRRAILLRLPDLPRTRTHARLRRLRTEQATASMYRTADMLDRERGGMAWPAHDWLRVLTNTYLETYPTTVGTAATHGRIRSRWRRCAVPRERTSQKEGDSGGRTLPTSRPALAACKLVHAQSSRCSNAGGKRGRHRGLPQRRRRQP
jgi:hypothetical protein